MKKTGVEARSVKRQAQLKKARKFAEQLFDDNFRENAEPPSQELFEKIWTQILEVCTEKLTTAHQLRIAHTRLETLVKTQKWNVFIPTFVISRELPLQMRTGEWLSRAWAVYDSYENWVSNASPMLDDRDVYADLILSLIFHSGQCDKNVIRAFSQHLQSGDFLIQSLYEQLFVTLVLESKSEGLNTNVDRDGEQITQYQCYLHPFTVGLLRYWKKIQHKWPVPLEMDAIFQSISVRFVFPDKFPRSLRRFLDSAIYTVEQGKYLSQALVEYRSGRVNSYSLSSKNIDRIENPVIYPCNIYSFSRPITATRPDVLIKSRRLRTERLNDDVAMEKLRKCLILAKSENQTRRNLEEYLERNSVTLPIETLANWLIFKSETCKVSSLLSYISLVGSRWLYINSVWDLTRCSSEELADIYTEFINGIEKPKLRQRFSGQFTSLHKIAVVCQGLPLLSSTVFRTDFVQKHTNSGYIDELLFSALLDQINLLQDISPLDKISLKVICIISFRSGLRISEIRKLRVIDIEPSDEGWINVMPNKYGDNKSINSRRRVPFYSLLTINEKKIATHFIELRRKLTSSRDSLLFELGMNSDAFDANQVSSCIINMLRQLSGLDNLVFHHLRHSAINRLHFILELGTEAASLVNIIPYNEMQIEHIVSTIFKKTKQHKYEELSKFSGHSDINVTFESYLHFSDWISSKKISCDETKISKEVVTRFHTVSKNTFYKIKDKDKYLFENNLNRYFVNKYSKSKEDRNLSKNISLYDKYSVPEVLNFDVCRKVLDTYSDGYTTETICDEYGIEQATLNVWLKNAKKIKAMKTHYGNYRHFSNSRSNMLTPARPKSYAEKQYVKGLLNRFRMEYLKIDINEQERFRKNIRYILNNSSISKSGVYFKDPELLNDFVGSLNLIVPVTHWRAMTLNIENSSRSKEWRKVLRNLNTLTEKCSSKNGRVGRGAVRLELVAPGYKQSPDARNKKRSSHLIQYVAHMMAIMKKNIV